MSAAMIRNETTSWQAGDLALCIRTAPWVNDVHQTTEAGPQGGAIHRVAVVAPGRGTIPMYLGFDEWPDNYYEAHEFRRIVPDLPTEADREVARIKRAARLPVPV